MAKVAALKGKPRSRRVNSTERADFLKRITDFYLASRDFNGVPLDDLGEDYERIRTLARGLVSEGEISLNFGDRHPNPHILAFEPEPINQQVEKLDRLVFQEPMYEEFGPIKLRTNWNPCCVYPTRSRLRAVVDPARYSGRPYTLLMAQGEPQIGYRAFNLRVLEFYRNDPRYWYTTDDIHGNISARTEGGLNPEDETFLQTFGFAYDKDLKSRYVAVFLRYLSGLTPEHQQRWKLDEVTGETFLHPDYEQASAGVWPENDSVFNAFCEEARIINEMTMAISGKPLFREGYSRENKPPEFGFLIRPTKKEYETFVHLLDKMMSDNLNHDFFDGKIPLKVQEERDGVIIERQKGTIVLLDEWLTKSVKFPQHSSPKDKMIMAFKEIRNERGPLAHKVRADKWDDSYFAKQRELIMKAYDAIRTLRLILANHPLSKAVKVPDWLYQGKIRMY